MCCAEISVASHYCGGFIYIDTHAGIDCFQHLLKSSQIYFCVTRHLCWLNESFKLKTNTILHSRMRSKAQLLFSPLQVDRSRGRHLERAVVVAAKRTTRCQSEVELVLSTGGQLLSIILVIHLIRGSSRNRSNGFKITTIMEQEVRIWHSFPVACPCNRTMGRMPFIDSLKRWRGWWGDVRMNHVTSNR